MLSKNFVLSKNYRPVCKVVKNLQKAGIRSSTSTTQSAHEITQSVVKSQDAETRMEQGAATQNVQFAKNLFLGKFDTSYLVYPEVENNEILEDLNQMIQPVEKLFYDNIDSLAIDRDANIPEETLQALKDLGLYGVQIPPKYGGLGLSAVQLCRIQEITAWDPSIAVTLAAHNAIGLKGIIIAGSEDQKAKYLPKLATGEYTAAFCLTEPTSGSDAASIQTRATLSEDGKHYLLNGNKIWISNGGKADVFTVFAKTEVKNTLGEKEDKITAFIVERNFGGLTSGPPEDKLGIRGSNTCAVYFDNCPVPVENVLGTVGGGFKLAMKILNGGRFSMGSSTAGVMKKVLGMTVEHCIERTQFGKKLKEFGLIQEKIANIVVDCYAMEAMTYLVAGNMDKYENPDFSVESAMCKIYSSEKGWEAIGECLQIMGGIGYMKGYPYERLLRDSRISLIFEGTNEILRLFVALSGMQHAGLELKDVVRKLKDPLNNVGFMFQKGIERYRTSGKNPKLTLKLFEHVHPSLSYCAEDLERNMQRFRAQVEVYLGKYRNDILGEQMALKRFADISTDLFACTAVLGRAGRALSIGLKNADHDAQLCQLFCLQANRRIRNNLIMLEEDKHLNGDEHKRQVAEAVFKNHGYASEHPLARNW